MEARQAPYNMGAEQAVLGCMLTNSSALSEVFSSIKIEDFYTEAHRLIFEAAKMLFDTGKPVDLITVTEALGSKVEMAGGLNYLSKLAMSIVTTQNLSQYLKIVKDSSSVRRLIEAANEIAEMGYLNEEEAEVILDRAEQKVFAIAENRSNMGFSHIRDILINSIGNVEKLREAGGKIAGIPTGFIDLDNMLAGLQKTDLILVAARPAMGKTAFTLNMAQHIAINSKVPVAVFNLEMSKEQIVNRILSSEARITSDEMKTGRINATKWRQIGETVDILRQLNIYIDDTSSITINEMTSQLRRMSNVGLVIIDYLQLMSTGRRSDGNRVNEISEITRNLKIMAKDLNVPVITLSQLSRASEQRPDKHPMLSDLRDSGSIEQDADIVMFLYREAYHDNTSQNPNSCECMVAKNRHGETKNIPLSRNGEYTKFSEVDNNHEE